jgi:hypothetical protein
MQFVLLLSLTNIWTLPHFRWIFKQTNKPKLNATNWSLPNQTALPRCCGGGGGVEERWAAIITGLFNEANRGADFISYNTATVAYWVYSPIFHAKASWQDVTNSRAI